MLGPVWPWILHFEPSLDAVSLRSDVINPVKIHSLVAGVQLGVPVETLRLALEPGYPKWLRIYPKILNHFGEPQNPKPFGGN